MNNKKEYPTESARKQAKRMRKIVRAANPKTREEALEVIRKNIPKKGLKKGVAPKLDSFLDVNFK